jgi:hypothetical protein
MKMMAKTSRRCGKTFFCPQAVREKSPCTIPHPRKRHSKTQIKRVASQRHVTGLVHDAKRDQSAQ